MQKKWAVACFSFLRVQRSPVFDLPDDLLCYDNKHVTGQRNRGAAAEHDINSHYNNRQYIHEPSRIFWGTPGNLPSGLPVLMPYFRECFSIFPPYFIKALTPYQQTWQNLIRFLTADVI